MIETVLGPKTLDELGLVLPHEHVLCSRGVNEELEPPAGYVERVETAERQVIREAQAAGVGAFVDVTPIGLGRFIPLYQRLSRDTGLHVIVSTGFYLAGQRPEWVQGKSCEDLAELFLGELRDGIGDTGVKPWMIKIAGGDPANDAEDAKIFRAAAMASQASGAAITTHSCREIRGHFDFLVEAGADPARLYMGHADFGEDNSDHLYIAERGGHLIFTCWGIQHFVDQAQLAGRVVELADAGLTAAVLMSIDYATLIGGNRMDLVSMEYECPRRTPAFLFRYALPELRAKGVGEEVIQQIIHDNPRRMLERPGSETEATRAGGAPAISVGPPKDGMSLERYSDRWAPEVLRLVNANIAGWPYCRPIDEDLLARWQELGEGFQPEQMLLALRDGRPVSFAHGNRHEKQHTVHLLAMLPGDVAAGAWLLGQVEAEARAAGAERLCGPTYQSHAYYAGYILGEEPYHPDWARDGTEAFVRAGWHLHYAGLIMVRAMAGPVAVDPMPPGYQAREVAAEEFGAKAFGYHAYCADELASRCNARLYPLLRSPGGSVIGQVGPVSTMEPHRCKGLARVLCQTSLERLQQMGAGEALIATGLQNYAALRAYERAGFERRYNINEWSKKLS